MLWAQRENLLPIIGCESGSRHGQACGLISAFSGKSVKMSFKEEVVYDSFFRRS